MTLEHTTCKNCGHEFSGNYCNHCGEKIYTDHDKSIGHLFEEGLHFITHFEGKFFLTLRTILLKPGMLSLEYCEGIRKKYFKPLSFFLLLVILYLLFPILKGLNMELGDHLTNVYYGYYAQDKISAIMSREGWSLEQTTEHFRASSGKVSKFLLFIIIPVMALLCWAVWRRKKKLFFDHFIFSTEMASFFILWGFLLMPLLLVLLRPIVLPLGGMVLYTNETFTVTLLLVPFALAVIKASKKFYYLSKIQSVLFTLLFITVFIVFTLSAYKFLLFFITAQLLH